MRIWMALLVSVSLGCGGSSDSSSGGGAPPPPPPTTGGGSTTGGGTGGGGGGALLSGVSFVQIGKPASGHNVITDMVTYNNQLYFTTSVNPLGSFGANVFRTTDGTSFTTVINDSSSQGFLRIRIINGSMYIADGDPNGLDPSYVYISANGVNFSVSIVTGSVHTFDVAYYGDDLICSNGMANGNGSLCETPNNGASPWVETEATGYSRLKTMVVHNGILYAGKRTIGSSADYVRWTGDIDSTSPQGVNAVTGEAVTWRWYVSAANRLYWSMVSSAGFKTYYTDDGTGWTEATDLAGRFVSDFAELDGNVYALTDSGLYGSTDGAAFSQICPAPSSTTFGLVPVTGGSNADATASMTVFNGQLWCGSSNDGYLYRVE